MSAFLYRFRTRHVRFELRFGVCEGVGGMIAACVVPSAVLGHDPAVRLARHAGNLAGLARSSDHPQVEIEITGVR